MRRRLSAGAGLKHLLQPCNFRYFQFLVFRLSSRATENSIPIPVERIEKAIYLIRGQKVMLDRDLAHLYGIDTKILKRAVRRNIERFPADFMFVLNSNEFGHWRRQFGASNAECVLMQDPLLFRVLSLMYHPALDDDEEFSHHSSRKNRKGDLPDSR